MPSPAFSAICRSTSLSVPVSLSGVQASRYSGRRMRATGKGPLRTGAAPRRFSALLEGEVEDVFILRLVEGVNGGIGVDDRHLHLNGVPSCALPGQRGVVAQQVDPVQRLHVVHVTKRDRHGRIAEVEVDGVPGVLVLEDV